MKIPRIIIAGTQSGVGKTTVSIGLMGALKDAGYKVQPFKVGPDYIDPSYHSIITGRLSENLDSWMTPQDQIIEVFNRSAIDADFAVIEGVMGLYDGVSGIDETGSTAHIAKILNCPVILVIDAHNMVRASAAITLGFQKYDEKVNLKGVILNNVAGRTHALWCKDAIESATGIPVVGWLPVNKEITLPERHLGLIPTAEKQTFDSFFQKIKGFIKTNINLDNVMAIAKSTGETPKIQHPIYPKNNQPQKVAIGIAFDEAFNFYYPSNLSLLEAYGAEIKWFSPIHDKSLPEGLNGLYLGGGFPEIYAKQLEVNDALRNDIRKAAESGMPIFAECAGLMYLTDSIQDFNGNNFCMAGVLHGKTVMTKKTLVIYSLAKAAIDNLLCPKGTLLKGHEFHNSIITGIPDGAKFAFDMEMGVGIKNKKDGWMQNKVLASYMHVHFAQKPIIVKTLLENLC